MRGRCEWLAKVVSFAFPRTFSVGPLPKTDDMGLLLDAARDQHHVCFKVQLTAASKEDVGREVIVQVQADDAIRLGEQMIRVANFLLPSPSPSKGEGEGSRKRSCGDVKRHPSHTYLRMEVLFQCPGVDGGEHRAEG